MAPPGLRRASVLRPSSTLLCRPHDGSAETQQDLVHCVHCGRHWLVGDAIAKHVTARDVSEQFGFCARCNGIHCPGERCAACVPIEQQLENLEAGRPATTPGPVRLYFPETVRG